VLYGFWITIKYDEQLKDEEAREEPPCAASDKSDERAAAGNCKPCAYEL